MGYVPQLETVDWTFPVTVEQVILLGRASEGWLPWPKRDARERAYDIMQRLGIAHCASATSATSPAGSSNASSWRAR